MPNIINLDNREVGSNGERGMVECDCCKERFNSFNVSGWSSANKKIFCKTCSDEKEEQAKREILAKEERKRLKKLENINKKEEVKQNKKYSLFKEETKQEKKEEKKENKKEDKKEDKKEKKKEDKKKPTK